MANNKMLIDASHPEETRVVVVRGNRIEEFDFEAQERRQLRGNIYLAKVTRVEPSLQAAFIDYGGNRHGFLAFSEIHPDYYQIPAADRQALLEEEAAEAAREAEKEASDENSDDEQETSAADAPDEDEVLAEKPKKRARRSRTRRRAEKNRDVDSDGSDASDDSENDEDNSEDAGNGGTTIAAAVEMDSISEPAPEPDGDDTPAEAEENIGDTEGSSEKPAKKKPARRRRKKTAKSDDVENSDADEADTDTVSEDVDNETTDSEQDGNARKKRGRKPKSEAASKSGTRRRKSKPVADDPEDNDTEANSEEKEDQAGNDDASGDDKSDSEDATKKSARGKGRKRGGRRKKQADKEERSADADEDDESESDEADENGNGNGKVESIGQEDALEEVPVKRPRRQYKIQEVIRRRQIMLVQVVKEERGNKGAALTTYLSLAGRYSVLMPNTARGGGISRKITNPGDRKRLKEIAASLDVPQGMGVILRTAGAARTEDEIKRDFEYLMRLWENVRSLTLESTAPFLVYEEGSLIKRSIRDLYNKDIGEIIVAGEDGYREARDFVEMLMPSQAKSVKLYKEEQPLFSKFNAEAQLDKMLGPQVTLKSGGYLVINQTEALVAIDVNSGRSTREHSIEATALQTNLEAAEEIARQLRLRDLAGLVVIDFIDMEEKRNNRAVERKLKDCLKNDRARIQVGHISHFGLLEMSRQRMRASVMESTMAICPTCDGMGHIRSDSSFALHIVRAIDEHLNRNSRHDVVVKLAPSAAIYILNNKRQTISELEDRYGVCIEFDADPSIPGQHFTVEKGDPATREPKRAAPVSPMDAELDEASANAEDSDSSDDAEEFDGDNDRQRKGRRSRGRRGRRGNGPSDAEAKSDTGFDDDEQVAGETEDEADNETDGDKGRRKRNRSRGTGSDDKQQPKAAKNVAKAERARKHAGDEKDPEEENGEPKPGRRRTQRPGKKSASASEAENQPSETGPVVMGSAPPRERKPRNTRRVKAVTSSTEAVDVADPDAADAVSESVSEGSTSRSKPKKAGKTTNKKTAKAEPTGDADPEPVAEEKVSEVEPEASEPVPEKKTKSGWRGFFS